MVESPKTCDTCRRESTGPLMVCERCHDGSEWIPSEENTRVNKNARKISRLKGTIAKLRTKIKEQQETIDGLNFRLTYPDD